MLAKAGEGCIVCGLWLGNVPLAREKPTNRCLGRDLTVNL